MEGSGDNPWRSQGQQTGRVSFSMCNRKGGATRELRIRYDCPPKSMLADVLRSSVDHSRSSSTPQLWSAPFVGAGGESGGPRSGGPPAGSAPPQGSTPPVMLVQVGESRQRGNSRMALIQLISGRIFLRGETVHVSRGVPHYSENSQIAPPPEPLVPGAPLVRPPALWGSPHQELLNLMSGADLEGVCLFFDSGGATSEATLQMGSRQTLIQKPHLRLSGRQFSLESVARLTAASTRVRPVRAHELNEMLGEQAAARAIAVTATAASLTASATASSSTSVSSAPRQRNLLLLAGRCILQGDSVLLLSGLLHFAGRWRRIDGAKDDAGMPKQEPQSVPCLSGVSILKQRLVKRAAASAAAATTATSEDSDDADPEMELAMISALDRPLLLSNVWLYAQGGTVFAGKTPILSGASLTMPSDSTPVALERQEQLLPRRVLPQQLMRLFLQGGRFTVAAAGGVLKATAGVAWLRAMKVRLGRGPSEQLTVRDALVFLQPAHLQDAMQFEGRDILYKEGVLYLDDLTPLLAGGRICLGQRELPLDWLSGMDDENRTPSGTTSTTPPPAGEEFMSPNTGSQGGGSEGKFVELMSGAVCVLEPGGRLHLLRGKLMLPGEPDPVVIDQGVAHFSPGSQLPRRETAGFPPPLLVGRPVTRPRDTQQWAKSVDHRLDRATFEDADLSVGHGALWLNSRVPLLIGCRLLLNGRWFDSQMLPVVTPEDQLRQQQQQQQQQLRQQQRERMQQQKQEGQKQAQAMQTLRQQMEQPTGQQLWAGQPTEQQSWTEQPTGQQPWIGQLTEQQKWQQQALLSATGAPLASQPGFSGSFSVLANGKKDALMFSMKARIADDLQFLFNP